MCTEVGGGGWFPGQREKRAEQTHRNPNERRRFNRDVGGCGGRRRGRGRGRVAVVGFPSIGSLQRQTLPPLPFFVEANRLVNISDTGMQRVKDSESVFVSSACTFTGISHLTKAQEDHMGQCGRGRAAAPPPEWTED